MFVDQAAAFPRLAALSNFAFACFHRCYPEIMPDSYSDEVYQKYEWAKKHVDRFEREVETFRREKRFGIRARSNDIARTTTFYVDSIPDLPRDLPLLLGDAIHNLRGTLDYLAYALMIAAGGTPDKQTCFPIFDTGAAYQKGAAARVPGVSRQCMLQIDSMHPYKGGFGNWAWQLHRLDIVDKHRLLLAVVAVPMARTMTKTEKAAWEDRRIVVGPKALAARQYALASSASMSPVTLGYELGTFPAAEVAEEMGFSFDVAIHEPTVAALSPTFLLLRFFSGEVFRAIQRFEPYLVPAASASRADRLPQTERPGRTVR